MKIVAAFCFILLGCAAATAQTAASFIQPDWIKPVAPFRIVGNIYYVGTGDLAVYLIKTPEGDIVIDGALEQTVPQVEANIRSLGVRLTDIKLILNSHAHFDHAAGIAQLKKDSGAHFDASAADKPILEGGTITFGPTASVHYPPVKVDHVIADGETVGIGDAKLTAHLTPGHTPGCTTWTMPVREDGVTHNVVFYCSTSVAGNPLVGNKAYPRIAADYRASFAKLKTIKADVFLAPHASFYDPQKKLAARKAGGPNPFIDPSEFQTFVAASEKSFEAELAKQQSAAK